VVDFILVSDDPRHSLVINRNSDSAHSGLDIPVDSAFLVHGHFHHTEASLDAVAANNPDRAIQANADVTSTARNSGPVELSSSRILDGSRNFTQIVDNPRVASWANCNADSVSITLLNPLSFLTASFSLLLLILVDLIVIPDLPDGSISSSSDVSSTSVCPSDELSLVLVLARFLLFEFFFGVVLASGLGAALIFLAAAALKVHEPLTRVVPSSKGVITFEALVAVAEICVDNGCTLVTVANESN